MSDAAEEINRPNAGKGFAHRLLVARRLARELTEPTARISSFGQQFAAQLHDVDEGFRAIIERGAAEVEQQPASKTNLCEFLVMSDNCQRRRTRV